MNRMPNHRPKWGKDIVLVFYVIRTMQKCQEMKQQKCPCKNGKIIKHSSYYMQ